MIFGQGYTAVSHFAVLNKNSPNDIVRVAYSSQCRDIALVCALVSIWESILRKKGD